MSTDARLLRKLVADTAAQLLKEQRRLERKAAAAAAAQRRERKASLKLEAQRQRELAAKMKARLALLRSWANFQAPSQNRMRHCAC